MTQNGFSVYLMVAFLVAIDVFLLNATQMYALINVHKASFLFFLCEEKDT